MSKTLLEKLRNDYNDWSKWEVDCAEDAEYRDEQLKMLRVRITELEAELPENKENKLREAIGRLECLGKYWYDYINIEDVDMVVTAVKELKGWQ